MARGSSTGLVTLECGHTRTFKPSPPVPGETVFCAQCLNGAYRRVISHDRQIKMSCQNCKYSRSMGVGGEAELSTRDAYMAGSRHVLRFPSHTVEVTDSDGVLKVISHGEEGTMAPLEGIAETRIEENKDHRASLRELW